VGNTGASSTHQDTSTHKHKITQHLNLCVRWFQTSYSAQNTGLHLIRITQCKIVRDLQSSLACRANKHLACDRALCNLLDDNSVNDVMTPWNLKV